MGPSDEGYSRLVALVLASTAIASYVVYRYYFSERSTTSPKRSAEKRDGDSRKEGSKENEPPKAKRSASDSSPRLIVEVPSATVIKAPSIPVPLAPKSRKGEYESDQSPKVVAVSKAPVKTKPAIDEIDVEFSPSIKSSATSPRVSTAEALQTPPQKQPSPPVMVEQKVNAYYCECGATMEASSVIEGELDENTKVEIMQTIIAPVHYDPFSAVSLGGEQGTTDLSDSSLSQVNPTNHSDIVPFMPILHAVTYAKKHTELLNQLIENYQYYERNYETV